MTSIFRLPIWGLAWLCVLIGLPAMAAELETVEVARADLQRIYRLDGVAEAISRSTVSAQTSGRVVEIAFDVDDYVRQGDVIVRIDDAKQLAAVRQAEANLSVAVAKRQDAVQEFERIEGVFAKQAVSEAEMDRATTALKQARASERAAQAALHQAEQELTYTQVRAPYNGIVTERLIEVGENAQPGSPLMTGLSLDSIRISVDVPQSLMESIRAERNAHAEVNGQWVKASKLTVFPVADPRSDTFKVRLQLPDGVEGIFPGMYVKVGFVAGSQERLVIPRASVVLRSEGVDVYVVDDQGQVHFRYIRLGSAAGPDHVSVLSGLMEGERVAGDPLAAGILLKAQRTAQVTDE